MTTATLERSAESVAPVCRSQPRQYDSGYAARRAAVLAEVSAETAEWIASQLLTAGTPALACNSMAASRIRLRAACWREDARRLRAEALASRPASNRIQVSE